MGRTKEQTREQNRKYHEKHRAERLAYMRGLRWKRETGAEWQVWARRKLLADARRRATAKGLPFGISLDDIDAPTVCPALGLCLTWRSTERCDTSPTLDRIDNTRGYVPGNVWVVSWRANRIKSNATPNELRRIADAVERKARAGRLLDGRTHDEVPR